MTIGNAFGKANPVCRISNSTAASIPHSSTTTLSFDTISIDTDNMFVSNKVRINTAGTYLITASCGFDVNNTGRRLVQIQFDDGSGSTTIGSMEAPAADRGRTVATTIWNCNTGDTIDFGVFQDSTATLNTWVTTYSPVLTVARIG